MRFLTQNLFFQTVSSLLSILTKKQKTKSVFLLVLIMMNSVFDVFSLVSVIPVLKIAQDTTIIHTNEYLSLAYNNLGFTSDGQFLMTVISVVFGLFVIKNVAGIYIYYLQSKFGYDLMVEISVKLYHRYMLKPLLYFKGVNSTVVHRNISNHPDTLATAIILPVLMVISESLVMAIIIGGIAFYNFKVFFLLLFVLVPTFLLIYNRSKNRLKFYGEQGNKIRPGVMSNLLQSIIGIVDVRLLQKESFFIKNYEKMIAKLAHYRAMQRTLVLAPPRITELTAFFGLVMLFGFTLFFLDMSELFPLIMLFAISIYRVMPCGNRIMNALMTIKSSNYALEAICELDVAELWNSKEEVKDKEVIPMKFDSEIELRNLAFKYPGKEKEALDNVSFKIRKGERIGIFGKSGSGKTTLINTLLGFFELQGGQITIDGKELNDELMDSWKSILGYVQQDVFILDASVVENIAFGENLEDIDREKVNKVVKMASLDSMVDELPDGLDTGIGESGSLISGGQKQRIGIARALYRDAQLLFFDEATSALDTATEKEITGAIDNLSRNEITSIIIAHRLTTLKSCDKIYEMVDGKIEGPFAYEKVIETEINLS